jgi:hypothetical protein
MYIKNSPKFYLKFFVREFFYQLYVLLVEPTTLKVIPQFFRQLPKIWKKRKLIRKNRKISVEEMEKYFV